ncbi:bifunctional diaminohydroxyphosphoribosylaminopyrimidine deaminase/5-amino-6-(5-phosphoribosylamino)uracil reductase RibD [Azospirillum brasilense]|uniref:bifunctional diaminohydroxyphosphoribosylaminopyrimidine deaminase/5-amino-6-(5-phosphoribosylamino)uracil reductase RibD n=1 Tax=Azospirillum brasilense TaxID=192 RepID=UPI000E6836B9|nr:bifunctional diaminohydroxyphosphoribosylaminopyrimidine deaminase/5-amino-6-(5-phosphoribosylamino)uracil reductase RibD [Azospirillum brasilense]NUB31842.1 bifunctional diaminohydroxyphosphoribosylaminopyrimidine deaminase/5-amino-6-(5-phosphoribosylamino)uracil reductase RibD [Azospirillum brasilense]RIW03323.1 bifunctional diaminohydroxyphosphoribosylaminopyrimidine deaminase/5-amino-6-(5-phosphoribosylamino)uracil reductase RibD [Azospirillum brasilense]
MAMQAIHPDDVRHMRAALALAARGLGNTWPNPAVGCVIVRDGVVVGRGWTQPGGRPHAETEALARAGGAARGATAYVTLEPCNHYGKTPPCALALVEAGVARVVVACGDPDPRVAGGGLERLRAAGIAVDTGVCEDAAWTLNEGFFRRIQDERPLYTLKAATTLDGRIATHSGQSQWITGPTARAWGHRLRATHDAIMVGIRTALADDPELTCRLPGLAHRSPVRIVVDSRLRLPLTGKLAVGARSVPTWVVTREDADPSRLAVFQDCGLEVIRVPADSAGLPDLAVASAALARRGLTRVLVEGGATLAASLLRANLVDRLEWFRAASVIGGDGLPAVHAFGVDGLERMARFRRTDLRQAGDDLVESYVRRG